MTHTTAAEWRKSKQKQRSLKAVIEHPIFMEAQMTILMELFPSVAGTTTIEGLAIKHARVAGIRDAFSYLAKLTEKPQKQEPDEEPFSHLVGGQLLSEEQIREHARELQEAQRQDTQEHTQTEE